MKRVQQHRRNQGRVYRTIVAAALALGGTLHMVTAVLANGTAAGTRITNEATATYEDPNDPNNTPITTTSNEVVVQVAEVAGITVQPAGIDFIDDPNTTPVEGDADGDGAVDPDDQLYYVYEVTNVGNDLTEFFIPDTAVVTTNNGSQNGQIEISYDGTNWSDPHSGGGDGTTNAIPPNGKVLVRVPIQVASNANPGDPVEVRLGDTPGDGQNQDLIPNGAVDVRTVDAPDGTPAVDGVNEVNGDPANGVREASARQSIPVDSTLDTQPLVTLEKILSNYEANNAASLTDDQLTYELRFEVESDAGTTGFTPGPLYPVDNINIDGTAETRILVSDALPDHTVLSGTPTAPAGWTVVYNAQDPSTVSATAADWRTTTAAAIANGTAGRVTRIGYVSNASVISLAPGSVVETFRFTVETTNVPTGLTEATFANIAQVFGSGDPGGDPAETVSDESGDNTPSNYNPTLNGGNGGFDPPGDGYIPDDNDDGVPDTIDPNDPTSGDGTDPSNTNSGTGTGGEANIKTIGLPSTLDLINGPENQPDAVGPTDTNDDFTNKSTPVDPADVTFDATDNRDELNPDPVDFANTVRNNGQTTGDITLVPTPPATPADLPNGTIVTITDPNGATAIYEYNGNTFTRTGGTAGADIEIPGVTPGQNVTYGVRVDLPDGTPLSTDVVGGNPVGGFPVPITATLDDNNATTTNPSNITIDRVYTGYLQLAKESRILQGSGPAVQPGEGAFSAVPKNPAPGNIIEYRVTYTNISETASGSGNVVLNAENVVVTEDGTDGGNNWALDNDNNSVIDTSNVQGSATDSNGGTITFFNGAPSSNPTTDTSGSDVNTDVTRYVDQVPGLVGPGESGFLLFRRVLN